MLTQINIGWWSESVCGGGCKESNQSNYDDRLVKELIINSTTTVGPVRLEPWVEGKREKSVWTKGWCA